MNRRYFLAALGALAIAGCAPKTQTATAPPTAATASESGAPTDKRVVLYCSVDDVYAKPMIEKLKQRTGLDIVPLFDTESTKTAGLTTRIRSEKSRVRADVLWTSALLQTLLLEQDGFLDTYNSPAAQDLAPRFRGQGWVGVGTRARILVTASDFKPVITDLMYTPVAGQKSGHSNPQFGLASDEAAALYSRDAAKTLQWYQSLKAAGVRITPGNGDVARAVSDGDLDLGWTDTDDYLEQKKRGKPIGLSPIQTNNILMPGAVALIKGAPHPENARKLFDAIASKEGEAALMAGMPGVFSLRALDKNENWKSQGEDFSFLKSATHDDYTQWTASWGKIRDPLEQMFQR